MLAGDDEQFKAATSMSLPCVATEPSDNRHRLLTNPQLYPLVAVLLLAAALRLPSATSHYLAFLQETRLPARS
jgi:hypothetical protein